MLNSYGINTAYDFIQLNEEWVLEKMTIMGLRMQRELKGFLFWDRCISVKKKKYTHFKIIRDESEIITNNSRVSRFTCGKCAEKLRMENSYARYVSVRTNPFSKSQDYYYGYKSINLEIPTNDSMEITKLPKCFYKLFIKRV